MRETRETIQKKIILEAVRNSNNHPTAEAIYQAIKEKYPNISMGTVYRNLNLLTSKGMIKRIESYKADCFDHRLDEHHHFKCKNCGTIFDVNVYQQDITNNLIKEGDFEIDCFHIAFYGMCTTCKNKIKKEKK